MQFNYNWRSSLLLIFFVHGLVYAFLLFRKGIKNNSASDKWLGFFLLLCILYICPWMLGYAGWYNGKECMDCRNFMFYMPMTHPLLMAPGIFFYIKSLLNPSFKFQKKDYWHFVLGTLYILWNVFVAFVDNIIVDDYYLMDGQNDPDFQNWYVAVGLVSLLCYLLLSYQYYTKYRAFILQELSFADTVQFKWVRNFLIACFIYFFSTLLLDLMSVLGFNVDYTTTWWYYLLFALLFYYIAITGYANSIERKKKFELDFLRYHSNALLTLPQNTIEDVSFEVIADKNQPISNNEDLQFQIWKTKVQEAVEQNHLYRDPELTLTDLANQLGTNASLLSKVINRSFNLNFNDFINKYRVIEVKEKLADIANSNLTIMSLAYDAGFNSKATFNRAFKKYTGENPRKYQIK